MPHFPAFIDLNGDNVLVVGAGPVATRKIEGLLQFGPSLTVVARRAEPEVEALAAQGKIRLELRSFQPEDLAGRRMVVVGIDDLCLQAEIFAACERERILCNCVDQERYCNFLFPAHVIRGDLVVGVTTSGRAPSVSAAVRRLLERVLGPEIKDIVESVAAYRASLPPGRERMKKVIDFTEGLFRSGPGGKA